MTRTRRALVLLALGALTTLTTLGTLRAQEAREISERMTALRNAAADRDLGATEAAFAELRRVSAGDDTLDEGRLLVGKTRMIAGRHAQAAQVVEDVVDRADSPWRIKALYLVAESAARRRNWKQAADIYAKRVEWASSDAHKEEVAQLYREIADGAFLGDVVVDQFGREKRVPDWNTARVYYQRARGVLVPKDEAALVDYRIGKSALETGDANGAVNEWKKLLEGEPGEWADDTLYGLGQAHARLGRGAAARKAFERLREEWGDSEYAALSLIRTGETWRPARGADEEIRQTIGPWKEFLRLHPTHDEASSVSWRIGELLFNVGKPRDAADAFRDFLERFPEHDNAPAAQDFIARAHLALGEFDQAIREWQTLLGKWPNHSLWAQAQRNVAETSFLKAKTAFDEKKDGPARAALNAFLEAFPVNARAPQAQQLLGDISARAKEHDKAVDEWKLVTTKYPDSGSAPAAAFKVAATYEGPLADLEKALTAYEDVVARWPHSHQAREARTVLAQMKGKTLEARVPRALRTNEDKTIAMRLRNVDRLRMKAYRIDPQEYLRRKGGLPGVERVEVDIVKPDHAWDWTVPDFEKYRLLDRECTLPFGEPGMYIVTAAEQELTATFMVLVSDLTTIVKSARGQALVFVYDERTGKPVRGAHVKLLGEDVQGTTGADGVWRQDKKGLGRVRAIVTGRGDHAGHFAYADGTAAGAVAFGYTTKVFLHTDRPLYRPGHSVHIRGIVRRVRKGRYSTEKNLKVSVKVVDPRGAVLLDRKLATDEYGVISHELELASEPSLGTYQVQANLDGRGFTREFQVLAYKKPDVLVRVKPQERTYLVGDRVTAKMSLRFRVGGSVAGATTRWTVFRGPFTFDPSVHEAFSWFFRDPAKEEALRRRAAAGTVVHARGDGVTDEDGELEISFATDAVEEDRTYTIFVEAQDPNRRWVQSTASIPVTRRGAYVICRTEKKVYRPGEKIVLEVTAVDPLHVPLELEGEGILVRRKRVAQHFVEDEVARAVGSTDAAGRATVELKAEKPGEYTVKFVTRDARGNVVEGAAPLTVSGDAEDLAKQAKLVANREFYRDGDVAEVLVNVPVAPAPVLITYEGDRVLEHLVFMATERSNTLKLPLTAKHAPNVFLRMAVAKDGKLYEDGDEVAVFQYLNVSVKAEPGEARPGDKVRLLLETTDQSGKPVAAEVSVDVIDAVIYQLAADTTPQIKPFFYDQRRTHAVRTASSAGVALPSVTRPTNKDLLFEQMRRLGKAQFEKMKDHVRRARELLEGGYADKARQEVARALEIAPGNYEARALLDAMDEVRRADRDARASRARKPAASKAPSVAMETLKEAAGKSAVFGRARPGARRKGKKVAGEKKDAGADFEQDEDRSDAPMAGGGRRAQFAARDGRYADDKLADNLRAFSIHGSAANALLLAQAAPLMPAELRTRFLDTALSRPSVRTGADGKGSVEVELPDNLTEWRVTVRGAGKGPLVGEGSTSFVARKKILIRADTPRFLTQGDRTTGTGTVHSNLDEPVEVTVRVRADGLQIDGDAEQKEMLPAGGVRPFDVGLRTDGHGLTHWEAEALTTVESDAARLALPVVPYGRRAIDGASGILVEEAFSELDLPENVVDGTTAMVVTLSPSVDIALLESLAYTASYPWGCVEQTVNRFLPALASRQALDSVSSWNQGLKDSLSRNVERGLAALYSLQRDDGAFGWFGARRRGTAERSGNVSAENTAFALLGMVRAELAGYRVSRNNRDRAVEAAKRLVKGASYDDRAFLLYALSFARAAQLEDLNKLHRERERLSVRGLALLALSMQNTGRPSNAVEALRLLETRVQHAGGFAHWDATRWGDRVRRYVRFTSVDVEPTAYALLAYLAVEPENPLVDAAAAWISANRRGPAWRSTRDTGAAVEALAAHAKSRGVERAECDVDIYVNGGAEPVATLTFGGGARPVDAPVATAIPAELLRPGENRIVLRKRGQGRVHWSALLSSVVRPPEGKTIAAGGTLVSVTRHYTEWVRPPLPGEKPSARIVPGYSVVHSKHRPKGWKGRPLGLVGTGDKVRVHVYVSSKVALDRVILEDPLPAGFEVITGSADGPFDREERRDDRQVFFFSRLNRSARVSYVIQAIHPGAYCALPATARPMYEPEIHGWSKEDRVSVSPESGLVGRLPSGEDLTPDEIWGLAMRAFERKDWEAARDGIEGLMQRFELVPGIHNEALAKLFVIGIETDDAELTVKSYEALRDRNPRWNVTDFRQRRLLARAYQGLAEHERALSIYRALTQVAFAVDREAAQAFASIGNPWRRRDLLTSALRRQPDVSWVEAEELQLARQVTQLRAPITMRKARDGHPIRRTPASSNAQPFLLNEAVTRLRSFQAHHAASRLAHEAGYLAVQALLKMELSDETIEEGTRFIRRHGESRYLDDVTYLVAEGHFQAGDYDRALGVARRLLDREFPRDDNPKKTAVSPFRSRAIHLTAKVAHLRGDIARAVKLYRQVEGLFPDARDAREFLTRKGLELPEVVNVAVGDTPKVPLRLRNLDEARVKAYAVDFMILYALRRDLSAVNQIDLSGVKPMHEWTVRRKGPEDFQWQEEQVELPAREKGVYLVVASGGGLDTSSVVLVSDLKVSVQQVGGKLRVYTTRNADGSPWGEVYVKVGNGNTIQAQGFTDARGVFEAGSVGGSFSVVAEQDGHVALWRR